MVRYCELVVVLRCVRGLLSSAASDVVKREFEIMKFHAIHRGLGWDWDRTWDWDLGWESLGGTLGIF